MSGTGGEAIYVDPTFASFYDLENGDAAEGGRPDFDFCRQMAANAASVLDLGCGTGELAASIAAGRRVVGVDPAAAMLEVARGRPNGGQVTWVNCGAAELDLGERFDLIVMTGHAFQTLLTDQDVLDVLSAIRRHLAPEGRFIFDSRNPAVDEWKEWTREKSERTVLHPQFGVCAAWNDVAYDAQTGIVTYETAYQAEGRPVLSSFARIRFIDRDHLDRLIAASGLVVERLLGDWQGTPYEARSKEIIPVGRLR
ncbi:class I SAM-dependent methyltransferase [Rhizobium alvei]|uniref:Class I SAM-dependent methyltransferase n=1 Tax=Rhizobium alvei TaxID=1132659 RepID=A0ABT8YUG1_9HYPH|nr:class I SAM-dependent methyltransferase [Rhizobium alvei]MDO6966775.1 class I SAM-dependent methyltransferase [Rhizobium alvei]